MDAAGHRCGEEGVEDQERAARPHQERGQGGAPHGAGGRQGPGAGPRGEGGRRTRSERPWEV